MVVLRTERVDLENLQRLLPKRDRIKAALRALIQELSPGAALPSISALRQQFGVSQHTIDRVIGDLRTEGLLETRHRSGIYVVNPARPLTIGILSQLNLLSSNSFYGLVAMALHQCATPKTFRLRHYFFRAGQDDGSYEQLCADVQAGELDGMFGLGTGGVYLESLGIPFLESTSLQTDGFALVRLAVEALVVRGCRRLALLSHGAERDGTTKDMFGEQTAFQMAVAQAGAATTAAWMRPFRHGPEPSLWGYDEFTALWECGGERPDGLLSVDDNATRGMLLAAERLGIAIPKDLLVASHANSLSPLPDPAKVIRVEFDTVAIAQALLARLQARIAGRAPEPSVLLISPRVAGNALALQKMTP